MHQKVYTLKHKSSVGKRLEGRKRRAEKKRKSWKGKKIEVAAPLAKKRLTHGLGT